METMAYVESLHLDQSVLYFSYFFVWIKKYKYQIIRQKILKVRLKINSRF